MKYKATLIAIGWLIAMPAYVLASERSETLVKQYRVTTATTIEIINKYGKVHVIPWEKDSVKIVVDLTVRSNNEERLEKIYSNVDFDFINTPGFITARTIIGSRTTSVWTDISTLTRTMFSNGSDMTIDYTVYMPERNKLMVENKYGDVFTGKLTGKVTINMAHGDLKATSYLGSCDLTLKYGNASIKYVKSGQFQFEYADLNLDKAEKLSMESSSGEIKIDKIDYLRIKSRRGEYFVKEVKIVQGESSFTHSTFIHLEDKIYLNSSYGSLTVEFIPRDFKSIDLDVRYGDVNLTFVENAAYLINVTHRNSTITFPKDKAFLNTTSMESDDKQKITSGKIGAGSDPSVKLNATMDRSTLNLFSK